MRLETSDSQLLKLITQISFAKKGAFKDFLNQIIVITQRGTEATNSECPLSPSFRYKAIDDMYIKKTNGKRETNFFISEKEEKELCQHFKTNLDTFNVWVCEWLESHIGTWTMENLIHDFVFKYKNKNLIANQKFRVLLFLFLFYDYFDYYFRDLSSIKNAPHIFPFSSRSINTNRIKLLENVSNKILMILELVEKYEITNSAILRNEKVHKLQQLTELSPHFEEEQRKITHQKVTKIKKNIFDFFPRCTASNILVSDPRITIEMKKICNSNISTLENLYKKIEKIDNYEVLDKIENLLLTKGCSHERFATFQANRKERMWEKNRVVSFLSTFNHDYDHVVVSKYVSFVENNKKYTYIEKDAKNILDWEKRYVRFIWSRLVRIIPSSSPSRVFSKTGQ